MPNVYNHKVKVYPDCIQHFVYSRPLENGSDNPPWPLSSTHKDATKRKEIDNQKRARIEVFDLCRCNKFDWFFTLTFDSDRINSFHYDSCVQRLKSFTKFLSCHQCRYIFVPEQHKSGRWHFHGLVSDSSAFVFSQAFNKKTGKPIVGIYNLDNYKLGFSTASRIRSHARVSSYVCKYLTKSMSVPKGRKRYWCSSGLDRPMVAYSYHDNISELYKFALEADFSKVIHSEFLDVDLFEIQF